MVTRLLTGNARIRLTAVTLGGLPDLAVPSGPPGLPEVREARAVVTAECAVVEAWFDWFAGTIALRSQEVPPTPPVDDLWPPRCSRPGPRCAGRDDATA